MLPIAIVCGVVVKPVLVHVTPSAEYSPVSELPVRVSLIQVEVVVGVVEMLVAVASPVAARYAHSTCVGVPVALPAPGSVAVYACMAPVSRPTRIITAALAYWLVGC